MHAQKLYSQAISLRPDIAEAHLNLAIVQLLRGDLDQAQASILRGLDVQPNLARGHYHLGDIFALQGKPDEAATAYGRAIQLNPDYPDAYNNLGNVLLQLDRVGDAEAAYRNAIRLRRGFSEALNNLAGIALRRGLPEEAIPALRRALNVKPDYAEAHNNLGNAFRMQRRFEEAANAYADAIRVQSTYAEAYGNLGNTLLSQQKVSEAMVPLQRAVALKPNSPAAHNDLGNAFKALGRLDEAEERYRRAIVLDPAFSQAYQNFGMVLCERNRIGEAFALFTRAANLAYASPNPSKTCPPHKERHDIDQRAWQAAKTISANSLHLESAERLPGPAVNLRNDVALLSEQWHNSRPQVVVIDDLLVPEALAALRQFCWGSTVWRRSYDEGYLGAMPEDGFAPPLLAQIAEELRAAHSEIFGSCPLLHHWAFKYDSALNGIKVHADFAAVNVNFWITPDEANLNPLTGGLIIWDVAAPLDWDFEKYNSGEEEIRAFLARENAKSMPIPYRSNRAVIFDSDLFHETDRIDFKDGYEDRRINITLLYGNRGRRSDPAIAASGMRRRE